MFTRHLWPARAAGSAALLALLALVGACASGGATFRSGVGDAYLEHPPYYAGAGDTAPVGHLPVSYQRGAAQPAAFDPLPGADTPIGRLLGDVNGYLESLSAAGPRLVASGMAPAVPSTQRLLPPDVHFGCITPGSVPGEDCASRGDSALGRKGQRMRLAVGRPSESWVTWNRDLQQANQVRMTLLVSLEIGQYLTRQVGWRGAKSVELGTAHEVDLPWLTSLETPLQVLQLTGVVVDSSGRAKRIGAEGIMAVRTPLLASSFGAERILSDADVEAARTLRRTDLPGSPLAWQVALCALVAQLTGHQSGPCR